MNDLSRTTVAALVGGLAATLVLTVQPAVAEPLAKAKKVTSAMIKNGTIKPVDLNANLNARLAKADTALQSIPDGSVTNPKLADNSVTSPKLADNSVTSPKLADNSVTSPEIADNSVGGSELANGSVDSGAVIDGSLTSADLAVHRGSVGIDAPNLNVNECQATNTPIETGHDLTNDVILMVNTPGVVGNIQISGRQSQSSITGIEVVLCNVGGSAFNAPFATYRWIVIEN